MPEVQNPFLQGFVAELQKEAKHFAEKAVPAKAKRMYAGMKEKGGEMRARYGKRWKEVAARTAMKRGK